MFSRRTKDIFTLVLVYFTIRVIIHVDDNIVGVFFTAASLYNIVYVLVSDLLKWQDTIPYVAVYTIVSVLHIIIIYVLRTEQLL